MNSIFSRFGTIRLRITAIASIVVAAVLATVAIAVLVLVRREMFNNLDNSLAQRADTYQASFFEAGVDDVSILLNTNDEDRAAQLVDSAGMVIASTPNLAGAPSLTDPDRASRQSEFRSEAILELEDDAYRVLSREVDNGSQPAVLHVAQNIDDLNDTIRNLVLTLAAIVPLAVVILGALVWWLVGRTLAPVELIRAEVADISGSDLQRRVHVPDQADEVARLAATMNQMLERIDLAGQRQRQFVADASHELRTPLTRMRTELEVDLNQPELADSSATHANVLEEAIAVQELLEDLLFLARSDEQQHRLRSETFDLDDIVFREAALQRVGTPVRLVTSAVSAVQMTGDPNQITRVVQNLLANAVRHASSTVDVSLYQSDDAVRFEVSDDGPGVPVGARERIFERFGRADDSRSRSGGGTGLGLAIVRDIVTRYGGVVLYDESWTAGARFVVELPVVRVD